MAQSATINGTCGAIRSALEQFVSGHAGSCAEVFVSTHPFMRAIVVSDQFQSVEPMKRQRQVWDHLKKSLEPEDLRDLMGVHIYTPSEYERLEAPLGPEMRHS